VVVVVVALVGVLLTVEAVVSEERVVAGRMALEAAVKSWRKRDFPPPPSEEDRLKKQPEAMMMLVLFLCCVVRTQGFVVGPVARRSGALLMSDDSWSEELKKSAGDFETKETSDWLKKRNPESDARVKNEKLLAWLQDHGLWISEDSGWGQAPHSLALATSTYDENEGEDSGKTPFFFLCRKFRRNIFLSPRPRTLGSARDHAGRRAHQLARGSLFNEGPCRRERSG